MNTVVKARVVLADGACGEITHWIIDLLARRVTHLVVKVQKAQTVERLVAVGKVADVAPGTIRLRCTTDDLASMAPFTVIEWIPPEHSRFGPMLDGCLVHKLLMQPLVNLVKRACVPPEKIAVRAGLRVETTDGCVGRVEGLAVDAEDWQVSQLVLRSGLLWGSEMVTVPLAQINRIGGKAITVELGARSNLRLPGGAAKELGGRRTAL